MSNPALLKLLRGGALEKGQVSRPRTRDDVVRFGGEQETHAFSAKKHKEQPKPEKYVPGKHDEEKPDFSKKENREESGSGKKKGADMHFASAPMGGDATGGAGGPPGSGGNGDSSGKNGFPAKGSDGDGDGKKGEGKEKPSKKDWKTDKDGDGKPKPVDKNDSKK